MKRVRADPTWLKTRQQLLRRLKAQVTHRLGAPTGELRLYTERFHRQFPKRWRKSSKAKLLQRIVRSDLVYGGDFHAFSQAQRLHLRLLRSLYQRRQITLCCEFLEVRHQKHVDQYQLGKLSEKEFLRKIRWQQRWGFPWDSYRELLGFARSQKIRVVALNHIGAGYGLRRRDRLAAEQLVIQIQRHPERLHYVIFGELHMASPHLPAEVKKKLRGRSLKTVFIYQDEEDVYFRLARQGLETRVDVLEASADRFCVLSAPPWVKWQSYAMYLEETFDRDLETESGEDDGPPDLSDQMTAMVKLLARDLNVVVNADLVSVYSSGQSQLGRQLKAQLRTAQVRLAQRLVETGRSFYLPATHLGYVARPSVNHVADVAGRFIHAELSGQHNLLWDMPSDFNRQIWIEAVGFFSSKLINHKRAADTLTDVRAQLALKEVDVRTREVLALALDHRAREVFRVRGLKRQSARAFRPRRKDSYFEASRILGAMMGERLYQSYRQRWLSKQILLSWLQIDVAAPSFGEAYLEIVRKLEPGEKLGKNRAERL